LVSAGLVGLVSAGRNWWQLLLTLDGSQSGYLMFDSESQASHVFVLRAVVLVWWYPTLQNEMRQLFQLGPPYKSELRQLLQLGRRSVSIWECSTVGDIPFQLICCHSSG
jgi:hypothetical protein